MTSIWLTIKCPQPLTMASQATRSRSNWGWITIPALQVTPTFQEQINKRGGKNLKWLQIHLVSVLGWVDSATWQLINIVFGEFNLKWWPGSGRMIYIGKEEKQLKRNLNISTNYFRNLMKFCDYGNKNLAKLELISTFAPNNQICRNIFSLSFFNWFYLFFDTISIQSFFFEEKFKGCLLCIFCFAPKFPFGSDFIINNKISMCSENRGMVLMVGNTAGNEKWETHFASLLQRPWCTLFSLHIVPLF